jgi:hypothetical protein
MTALIDTIFRLTPIFLFLIIFICLMYSELTGISICTDGIMDFLHGVIVGQKVELL